MKNKHNYTVMLHDDINVHYYYVSDDSSSMPFIREETTKGSLLLLVAMGNAHCDFTGVDNFPDEAEVIQMPGPGYSVFSRNDGRRIHPTDYKHLLGISEF